MNDEVQAPEEELKSLDREVTEEELQADAEADAALADRQIQLPAGLEDIPEEEILKWAAQDAAEAAGHGDVMDDMIPRFPLERRREDGSIYEERPADCLVCFSKHHTHANVPFEKGDFAYVTRKAVVKLHRRRVIDIRAVKREPAQAA